MVEDIPTIPMFQICFSFISGISAILTLKADQGIEELAIKQEIWQAGDRGKESVLMRDAEHEPSQDESTVEITPLPAKDELPEAQNFLTGTVHQSNMQVGRTHRSGFRRYLLIVLTLCMLIALFLVTVVLPRYQSQKPSSHPSSLTASPTLNTTATPASVPIDYSVNTTIVNGVAYASAANGAVYALRTSDGSRLWYHPMYWVVYNPPVLVGSMIFVSTAGGEVYAFQASNGSLVWHFHTDVQ